MTTSETESIPKSLITPYRINTYITKFLDYELFKSEIEKTRPGTETTVHITNGEPLSSASHYDVNANVSRGFQKEIDGIRYSVDEISLTPKGKNLVLTIEEFKPMEAVPTELAFLTQRRTVALKDTDERAKIVLKIYMYKGKEVSVIDYVSNQSEINNSPYSQQAFFVTNEEEKLMKLLEMTS